MLSEINVYLAQLAYSCGRYEETIQYIEEIINSRENDLTIDQRTLLVDGYRCLTFEKLTTLWTVRAYEMKERTKDEEDYLAFILEYRKKIEDSLYGTYIRIISTIDRLLRRAEDYESKSLYLRLKCDYYRKIAMISIGDEKVKAIKEFFNAFNDTAEFVKSLAPLHLEAVKLAYSLSMFYNEVMNDTSEAYNIAKQIVEIADQTNRFDDEYCERDSILHSLREALITWQSELEYYNEPIDFYNNISNK
jgi:tetratricopeptide (TPR) repeat protein